MENFSNNLTEAEIERLAILIEECAEVQQIACKILRHGYESFDPTKINIVKNRNILANEIGDLLFSIEWLQQQKDIDGTKVRYSVIDRRNNIEEYLHFNKIS